MRTSLALALLLTGTTAHAGRLDQRQAFALTLDAGAHGRFLAPVAISAPTSWGLSAGLHLEMNVLAHLAADLRYLDGRVFDPSGDRMLELHASGRSPKLFFVALDVHELYWRPVSLRPDDDLFYVHGGIALLGDLLGTLKASLGVSYLAGAGPSPGEHADALGGYVGLEYLLRLKFVDLTARGTLFLATDFAGLQGGGTVDGDLFVKIPVGKVALGPKVRVIYRNLGMLSTREPIFGNQHEVLGTLGLAFTWGTGQGRTGPRRDDRDHAEPGEGR